MLARKADFPLPTGPTTIVSLPVNMKSLSLNVIQRNTLLRFLNRIEFLQAYSFQILTYIYTYDSLQTKAKTYTI